MTWYSKVTEDLSNIPAFISHFENELLEARKDVGLYGNVEKNITALPGITEIRFNQLQEVEAVLNHLNIQLRKIRRKHFVKYLENYARALTSRDAEKYVDGEDEVVDFETIIHSIPLFDGSERIYCLEARKADKKELRKSLDLINNICA